MLTVYEDTDNIFKAWLPEPQGILLKRTTQAELLEAIHEVHRGGSPMTTHIAPKGRCRASKKPPTRPKPPKTSPQGTGKVLDCLAQASSTKKLPEKLGISYETVHTYIRRIYEKLHVRTRRKCGKVLRR